MMTKEELQARLDAINADIQKNMDENNQMIKERDEQIQMKIAHHNMLIGRRDEVSEQLAKLEKPEA
jgi:ribosomal protein S24E